MNGILLQMKEMEPASDVETDNGGKHLIKPANPVVQDVLNAQIMVLLVLFVKIQKLDQMEPLVIVQLVHPGSSIPIQTAL